MRTYFNRNIRIRCLLTICLTWFIFSNYGGAVWNQDKLYQKLSKNESWKVDENLEFCNNKPFTFNSLWEFEKNRYTKDWYILFVVHAIIQVVYIALDIRTQITSRYYSKTQKSFESGTNQSLFMSFLMDFFVINVCIRRLQC